ncbi:MAG TPA: DUF1570 domain-containing protein [Gemmataceae bacterium]|nr:DUF1570 domain-containing protein [Gemmataceae bacterium]
MHCLFLTTLLGCCVGQITPLDNLDFRKGSLEGWEGQGFVLTGGSQGQDYAVTSSDESSPTRKGTIRHVLTIPAGISKIRFQAYAARAESSIPDQRLDVLLAGAGNRLVPRKVRTAAGWSSSLHLLGTWEGKPRDYAWDVSKLGGQRFQIVIVDQDDRPGSHVYCTGFHLQPAEESQDTDFAQYMVELQKKHNLAPMARFDSKRFSAYSNASEAFTALRLRQCEIFYDLFYNHFHKKGFAMHHPGQRLMLAVFDSPEGVDAYLGMKLSTGITGMYHPSTNRLLLYDLSENRFLVDQKKKALEGAKKISSSVERTRFVETVERKMNVTVQDVNLTTTMHEAAHQLSFNCGLLNRQGDVPIWLAEGLACYCEATESGEWQAIGAPNTGRVRELARVQGNFIPLQVFINEDWRNGRVLLGYSQSWALFRMLLQERPQAMKSYLAQIYARRAPEYRMADFRQAFGNDLAAVEQRYFAYLRDLVDKRK